MTDHGEPDLFKPFRPLMRPLSGMINMCLLTKGDKRIYLMGEIHQRKFCREQGYIPLSQIIENYLSNTVEHVDFMIEMGNSNELYKNESSEARQVSNEFENRAVADKEEPSSLIELTKSLLRHPKAFPKARVHWLDADIIFEDGRKGTKLMLLFYEFFKKDTTDEKERARLAIDECLIHDFGKTPPWYSGKVSFDPTDMQNIQLLFFQCFYALQKSKYLRKCYIESEDREQMPSFFIYWNAYIESHDLEVDFADINLVYYNLQRFFMDIYTCCRILKRDKDDPRWYKNIVIYAGNWHIKNYISILTNPQVGFVKLPVTVDYNPRCNPIPRAPKKKRSGTRRTKSVSSRASRTASSRASLPRTTRSI